MRQSLGWDTGAGEARWVELVEERGRPKVRVFGTAALPAAENSAASERLRALVAQRRWRGREVVTALPRTAVTLAWMALPAAARDDLAAMVELEAAQTLPFAVDEAAWDFAAGPTVDGGQAILLVAARRQLVEERRRQLEALGLRLGTLSVDVLGVTALARTAWPESGYTGVLVLLDAGSVTLCYVQDGRVLMSRTAALASSGSAERDVPALALEVRRTLVAGGAASSGGASEAEGISVWLTGHGADTGLAEALGAALQANGGAASRVSLLPRDAVEGAEALPRSLDLALGLALLGLHAPGSSTWDSVDLASRARSTTDNAQPRTRVSVPALVGVGAAALGIALLLLMGPSAKDRELAQAASRVQAEARQLATRRGDLEGRVRGLAGAIVPRHSYLDVLNEVSALAGSEIWLTQFTYDRGRPILIRGAARSNAAVGRLVEGLRGSPHLSGVTLGSMTESDANKTSMVQFIIQGTLRGDAPLEPPRRRRAVQTARREPT